MGEELASDIEVNRICKAFVKKKKFDALEHYQDFAQRVMIETGLANEDPDLIIAMEQVYINYREVELAKRASANRHPKTSRAAPRSKQRRKHGSRRR